LCPVDTFHREPLYRGPPPDEAEVQRRLQAYWKPYHDQLRAELDRLLALHGRVVLWDAHSIASHVPRFFEGKLPDLNFGTADGKSCDAWPAIVARARIALHHRRQRPLQGRAYHALLRRAGKGVHAIQLEMCQSTYMDEDAPYGYRADLAAQVQPPLRAMMQAAADWVRA
jgi:N-formylglutamate deformylase